ncbi:MAG: RDD family protein [Sphingobacteriales bacterium]|nr:MAG: RDD family protein [Sphingobacteriales bacterium]
MAEMEITYELRANAWRRLANYLIDLAMQYGVGYLVGFAIGILYIYAGIEGPYNYVNSMSRVEEYLLGQAIAFVYYFTFESVTDGRTIGKYITGTKALTWYGEKPSAGRTAKRSLCRLIPFNPFSFLAERPLGWHDSLSDTVVVDIKKYEQELNLKTSFEEIGAAAGAALTAVAVASSATGSAFLSLLSVNLIASTALLVRR